jgi:hypothetical protein
MLLYAMKMGISPCKLFVGSPWSLWLKSPRYTVSLTMGQAAKIVSPLGDLFRQTMHSIVTDTSLVSLASKLFDAENDVTTVLRLLITAMAGNTYYDDIYRFNCSSTPSY